MTSAPESRIFVFGSNLAGHHAAGAAAFAHAHRGAVWGEGEGLHGQSYAIPTMHGIDVIRKHVKRFKRFARKHPELRFEVTPIGCGIAGYTPAEIAPLFSDAPANCDLPEGWNVKA